MFSTVLVLGIFLLAIGHWPLATPATLAQTAGNNLLTVSAGPLSLTAVTLNNASSIILTANTTTSVAVNFTVSGGSGGCGNVFYSGGNVTTTLYRSGVSSTCGVANPGTNQNTLNCYMVATTTNNCASATSTASANATATFDVWYFADATDSSSSYSAQNWSASVFVLNASGTTANGTSTGQDVLTLLGMALTSSTLNYGTLEAGTDTTSTNQISTVKNAGNTSTTLRISGTAMTSGANSIATSSQHYATSTFTYGGAEQALQEAATAVSGWLAGTAPIGKPTTTVAVLVRVGQSAAGAHNGYLYRFGGYAASGVATSSAEYAVIKGDGTIQSWSSTTAMPAARYGHGGFIFNNYAYAIGGTRVENTCSAYATSTFVAPVAATGSLGAWVTTTAPYGNFERLGYATYDNSYMYVVGGGSNGQCGATSSVFYATTTATGMINGWVSTTPLPNSWEGMGVAAYNGYLYVFGGEINDTTEVTSTVLYAPISATGSLGAWTATTPMPSPSWNNAATFGQNGFLYAVGGYVNHTSAIVFAPILADGRVGQWSYAPYTEALSAYDATPIESLMGFTAYNNYLYTVGGYSTGGSTIADVQMIPVPSRNTYWGTAVPGGTAGGSYSSTITYTAVFSP